jgi:hypothetical protein
MENDQKELIRSRIRQELQMLELAGGIHAELISENNLDFVIYYNLETSGGSKNLPAFTDVVVAVPAGYPNSQIDMPGLEFNSPLAPFVIGGSNPQTTVSVKGKQWRFLSFHPYNGQGAPIWNPNKHGFHDYYQHLYTWLNKI